MGLWLGMVTMAALLCRVGVRSSGCLLSSSSMLNYTEEGHILLGMIGPVNSVSTKSVITFTAEPPPYTCDSFKRDQYKSILALLFATKEINQNNFLPNITLGFYMYDSCFSEATSLKSTLQVVTGGGNPVPNYKCGLLRRVPAIIGDPLSSSIVSMSRVLGLWRIPQVSYAATLPNLSNKQEFPSFLRTTVSVNSQPQALIDLCHTFGWTWIGILISSTDYGTQGGVSLKKEAAKNEVCIAFYETIALDSSTKRMPKIIENVRKSTASAVFLFVSPPEANAIFIEVLLQNVTGKVWVGIEAWFTSPVFLQTDFWNILNNTIGIAKSRKILPQFSDFLQNLNPSVYPRMLSIQQFWERTFNCKWPLYNSSLSNAGSSTGACTGFEKIVTDDITELNDPTSQVVYMAHSALYVVAHALQTLLSCKPGEGPFSGKSCADKQAIQPWQLLHYMKKVHFVNTAGEEVSFDAKGDIHGYFDILNWKLIGNKAQYIQVGTYNEYVSSGPKLFINTTAIRWPGGLRKVPRSVCSDDCPPGYRKAPQRGQPVCCFDCVPCPEGMISNETNSVNCQACPGDEWPNSRRNKCVAKVIEFLSYEEPLGLVMTLFSVLFFVITVMVLCIFLIFRNTAMVKANNRNLGYLLLLSLKFCFLCSLMFIGYPTRLNCTVRQSLFGITFSFCVSCILAKTIIVVIAFKATKPGSNLRVWVGFKTAIFVVTISTSFQMVIILVWMAKFPPFLEHNHQVLVGTILVECNEGSVVMFYCTIGYLGVLAAISFVVAFLARNLPDSFNEAKYITFSMFTFLSVWSTFIPAYLSTKGKYIVAVEIFAILLSSLGLLCCIFAPKCYIMLLKPMMNTRGYLMSKNN
ncbi:extracellular calcium-sensing receptor-like [Rana temporaria]|uniref:extracellular calcium-sensing receptor-like n=1 Tax=Rana temporaria TaxID=8407 RepID=UPI001AACA6FD|nr:extracellular calcium-sensing receptor-like [Rana temporaria]